MTFSIVVLTYNALEYTKKCIDAIKKNTSVEYELILIDNNSQDDTKYWLNKNKKLFNTLILNETNNGVAGGRNQGIEEAIGDYVVFLDNDTEVQKGWDKMILTEFRDEYVGVVGRSGTNIKSLDPMTFAPVKRINGKGVCDVVPGYCFAFRRLLIGVIGWQWEDFPNGRFWHEDLEFCYRVRLAGFKVITNEKIPVIHHGHKSMKGSLMSKENQFGFLENAKFIEKRMRDNNIIYYHRDWKGFDPISAYDRIANGLIDSLRELGVVVIRKGSIEDTPRSFDLCKAIDIKYMGMRFVTMMLENDKPPRDWEKGTKDKVAIFAGSPHLYEGTRNTSYANKIVNLTPLGINTDVYKPTGSKADLHSDRFIFLTVGASQPRKNTMSLIDMYCDTFTKEDNVVLVIKDGDYGQKGATLLKIQEKQKDKNCPRIHYIFEHLSSEDLARLYRRVAEKGVYIAPHRAEGFGMPHLEAVACGCPIATTNFGGVAHTLRDEVGALYGVHFFPYDLVTSKFHNHQGEPYYEKDENPLWAEPDKKEVKKFMKWVVNEKFNKRMLKETSKYIRDTYNYDQGAKHIWNYIKEYGE